MSYRLSRFIIAAVGLVVGLAFGSPLLAQCQWTTSGANISNCNTGNVGINTGAPSTRLDVNGITRGQLQDKGGQVFNVKAYGAVGNGVTDDTAAINSAITAAGSGITYLPKGSYLVSGTLTMANASGASLVGAGPQATIIKTNSTTGNILAITSTSYAIRQVAVRDLSFNTETNVTRTAGAAIAIGVGEQFLIDNVRIQTRGGDGIVCTAAVGEASQLWFVSNVDIEIWGAFAGIRLTNAGDLHLSHAWIRGPIAQGGTVTGSAGLDVGAGSVHAVDVELVQFERGVYVHPAAGQAFAWNTFINVYCDTNSLYGWHFAGAFGGSIAGTIMTSCWAGTNGNSSGGAGLRIENGNGYFITDFRCINNGGNGVEVAVGSSSPFDIEIKGGMFTGSGALSGAGSGILMGPNVSGFRIAGIRAGLMNYATSTQTYGINIQSGCNNYIVIGNDTRGNLSGGINNIPGTATTRILTSNL